MIDALPLLLGPEGYQISRSVRLRSSASASFSRTPASASNRKTWTWSGWVKRGSLGSTQSFFGNYFSTNNNSQFYVMFDSSNCLNVGLYTLSALVTTAVYRDPSSWYHIVMLFDSTQATASNRLRLFVNGVEVTSFSTDNRSTFTLNGDFAINAAQATYLGYNNVAGYYFDGYLTEINFIDGQALTPSSFGETDVLTGVWKPKKYAGTYGTNGFYLNFSDNSNNTAATIGKDYSGNGNNWTPNNISVTSGTTYDSMLDVPTQWADGGNGRGNYCTLNPLDSAAPSLITNGNLQITANSDACGTMSFATGKWYFEVTRTDANASNLFHYGLLDAVHTAANRSTSSFTKGILYRGDGVILRAGSTLASGLATVTQNKVLGVAFDMDAKTVQFYVDNVAQSTAQTITDTDVMPWTLTSTNSASAFNAGQRPFSYTPPSGFKALNTLNLPAPTILKGNQYFDALTWSGAGGSSRSITGLAFQPDLVWGKVRNTTYGHMLFDSARGAGSLKELGTNVTGAEGYASSNQYGYLSAFNSDGFTVTAGTDASIPNAYWNQSGNNYVGWQWKEGATQGFDIVTYTGTGANRTVSHSLGVAPRMIIIKGRDGTANNWIVYHASVGNTAALFLNLTNAQDVGSAYWNNTTPTSTQFSLSTASGSNSNGVNYVAYLFSEVAGFSRFGSYTGNGSTDGPFVFCGFRPRFFMWKRTDTTANWLILDTSRDLYNLSGNQLFPNLSNAEFAGSIGDIISNGFKFRDSGASNNASGGTYIFAAFAEVPFKAALAR
jgi:hypothetical protein